MPPATSVKPGVTTVMVHAQSKAEALPNHEIMKGQPHAAQETRDEP